MGIRFLGPVIVNQELVHSGHPATEWLLETVDLMRLLQRQCRSTHVLGVSPSILVIIATSASKVTTLGSFPANNYIAL